jgi:hypothetical protein
MGFAEEFVEIIAKEKWVVYLFLVWAAAFFFWGLDGLLSQGFVGNGVVSAIANLLYLVAGIFLVLFALKFLIGNFIGAISKVRLFAYFLLLWGGASFFFGVDDIIYFAPLLSHEAETAVALIAELFYLFSGVLLTLFGFRLIQSKKNPDNL